MSSMAKYLHYFKYLVWKQEKKQQNSYIGAQKIKVVKVADQPSSSRLTWKNIASLIVDRIQMFFCNICRFSFYCILITRHSSLFWIFNFFMICLVLLLTIRIQYYAIFFY
uniref:Uncharacterized protein n=1 Tax=Meloidogyne enterolobii TaxID=390850 RepID=A0A6V7VS31_MELEN|nr:unnamed protein product [Meloidogyne enterolobii]